MAKPPTKAQTIANTLAAQITAGDLAPGSWLPAERELAKTHNADRSTIRRAVQMLEQQGLVTQRPRTGVQVTTGDLARRDAADITSQIGNWRGFHVSAEQAGHKPYTRTQVREVEAVAAVARWLGVPTGTHVLERARLQGIEEQPPTQLSTTWIISELTIQLPILQEINTGPGGMLSRMEEAGHRLRFEDFVSCRLPLPVEIDQLMIDERQPVLDIWRRCYNQHNHILEVTHRVIASNRQELVYRYEPTQEPTRVFPDTANRNAHRLHQ